MASKKTRRAITAAESPHVLDYPTDEALRLRQWEDQWARKLVSAAVAERVAAWAKPIALTATDARFDRFHKDVIKALRACMHEHIAAPVRSSEHKRMRAREAAVAKAAKAAAEKLRSIQATTGKMPPLGSEYRLFEIAAELSRLAEEAAGRSGRPAMLAFAALVRGLAQAFRDATRQPAKITWKEDRDRYEGAFLALVEEILPTAREIAETVTSRPLPEPRTKIARGQFLRRLTAL
jgi:hypothetical protein